MKKKKVLSLLTMTMVLSMGITACSSPDLGDLSGMQSKQTVESSEEDVQKTEEVETDQTEEQTEEQEGEENPVENQDTEAFQETEEAMSDAELEEALQETDVENAQVDHVHQYVTKVLKEATCTEEGKMLTSCATCDYSRETVLPATGHEAGEWQVTLLPGRTTEGTRVLNCTKCGEVMGTESIEPTGESHSSSHKKSKKHTHSYTVSDEKEATCTEAGSKIYTCSCGASYMETIAAKGHDFSKTEVEEATCTTEGKVWKECATCGEKEETATLEKVAHTPGEWKTVKEPSYTELGRKEQYCTNCNELLKSETIPVLAHEHTYQVVEHTDATCEQDGQEIKACETCGDVEIEVLPATGHQMAWTTVKEATCTENGLKKETCEICGTEGTVEAIPATGHQAGDWTVTKEPTCEETGSEHRVCETCGAEVANRTIDALGHQFGDWEVTKEPTDDEAGSRRKECKNCGKEMVEEILPCGHHYEVTDSKESTCTEAGYDTYTCSECGKSYTEARALKSHEAGDWKTEKEATEEEEGKRVQKCTVCGAVVAEQTIPKLEHVHAYEETDRKNSTCEEDGYVEYTCKKDGDSYKTVLKATGHAWEEGENVAASCEQDGKVVRVCKNCDKKEETTLPATGHHYVEVSREEATCTTEGSVISRCENCGDEKTEVLEKVAHDYQTTETEPTCTADGTITYTCKKCGDTYTEAGKKATGHTAGEWTVIKAAQVGVEGEQVKYCTSCNQVVERQTIAALQNDGTDSIYTIDLGNGKQDTVIGHMAPQAELDEMVGYINDLRTSKGVSPLKIATNETLVKAGQTRAPEIAYYYDHKRPNGTKYNTTFMSNSSDYIQTEPNGLTPLTWGENIVYGSDADYYTVKSLFDAWVASSGHYQNMIDADFKQIVPYSFMKRVPKNGYYYDENGELRYGQVGYTYERYFGTIFYTDDKTN